MWERKKKIVKEYNNRMKFVISAIFLFVILLKIVFLRATFKL